MQFERTIATPDSEPTQKSHKKKVSECGPNFARSDSGKGVSLSSQDLPDIDHLHNELATVICPSGTHIPACVDNAQSLNCSASSDHHLPTGNFEVQECSVVDKDVSSNTPVSFKSLERQPNFDSLQDPNTYLVCVSRVNPSSLEKDWPIPESVRLGDFPGSPELSVKSVEDSCENNTENIQASTKSPFDPWRSPSSHNVERELPENNGASSIAACNFRQDHIQQWLSVPTTLAPTSGHHARFSSLTSHARLVPKDVMDNVVKELVRERLKVNTLQQNNQQLFMRVAELEAQHKVDTDTNQKNNLKLEQLHNYCQNIPFLMQQANIRRQKFDEKEKELNRKIQELEEVCKRCDELVDENQILNAKINAEQSAQNKSNDITDTLRRCLQEERARFERDVKSLKDKIDGLKRDNVWLREGLAAYNGSSMCAMPEESDIENDFPSPLSNGSTHIDQSAGSSGETQVKGVYPENAAVQNHHVPLMQETIPKLEFRKSRNDGALLMNEVQHSNGYQRSSGIENNVSSDENKCTFCYVKSSKFGSNEEFIKHKNKCSS